MCTKILFLFLILLFFCTKSICKKYYNYTLYRGMPVTVEHLHYFKHLSDFYSNINFWRPPSTVFRPIEFAMPPDEREKFLREAKEREIYLTTVIPDLQKAFDKQTVKAYIRRNMASFDWSSYFRLKDIYSWLKDMATKYPDEMRVITIGKTFEDRNINAVRIILKGSKRRSRVIVEGGVHAREWIAPAFVTYMISEILRSPTKEDEDLYNIAMTYEWYFVPVLNPDGYEYSHIEDRQWRKNRQDGHGVDINRNFGYGFGKVGVSKKKDLDIYGGPNAFSEKESQAMSNFISALSEKIEYYLAFHSYGQCMIIPYAHSSKHRENFDEVHNMGLMASKNISRRYGTHYSVGTAYETVGYKTSGVSGCWVKKTFNVPYVMTFELRDNGQFGFCLPPELILPTCRETMDGMKSILAPRTTDFKKLRLPEETSTVASSDDINESDKNTVLDTLVVVCNVFYFIIVRFD